MSFHEMPICQNSHPVPFRQTPLLSQAQVRGDKLELARHGLLPKKPQKLIVLVHGGPKSRDFFGFAAINAWLTSRGYAVMQVEKICILPLKIEKRHPPPRMLCHSPLFHRLISEGVWASART